MTRQRLAIAVAAVLLLVIVVIVFWRRDGAPADAAPSQTALVTLAQVRSQSLQDVVTVYGVAQADPAGSVTVAAPKAAIVTRMLVRSGEAVRAGQVLAELANAPGAELSFNQAAQAARSAQADLARVQRLYDERLAASDQLIAAKKAAADAQSSLSAQQKQGTGQARQAMRAPQAGVVTTVSAAAGDHVAQDAPLVVLARDGGAVAKLAVEPSGRFSVGQAVILRPMFGGAPITSRIAMLGRSADPATRTLDAIVPLNGATLPVGAAVQGEVVTGAHTGLAVPRSAVVFDETGPHLFLVSGGKAHRVFVSVGLDQGDDIEVKGPLAAGAKVAVEGAYELQDGMAVKVRGR
jgi:RND family efflux transporter MFP subunit